MNLDLYLNIVIKSILLSVILIFFFFSLWAQKRELNVIQRGEIFRSSTSTDSEYGKVISLNKKWYVIRVREYYTNNKFDSIAELHDEGYQFFTRKWFEKNKLPLEKNDLSESIHSYLVGNKHININSKNYLIQQIDEKQKTIYYLPPQLKELVILLDI